MTPNHIFDELKLAFQDAKFPDGCGLRAGLARDQGTADPESLKQITSDQDVKGHWWEIPDSELRECVISLSYLDLSGLNFYFPAFLMALVRDHKYSGFDSAVISWIDPSVLDEEPTLKDYYFEQFSFLTDTKKEASRLAFEYLVENTKSDCFDTIGKLKKILAHPFWDIGSK